MRRARLAMEPEPSRVMALSAGTKRVKGPVPLRRLRIAGSARAKSPRNLSKLSCLARGNKGTKAIRRMRGM